MAEGHLPDPIALGAVPSDAAGGGQFGPVLDAIRDAAARLLQQPAISGDAECRHLFLLLALAENPDALDDVATRLRARVTELLGSPEASATQPSPARASRVLLRL